MFFRYFNIYILSLAAARSKINEKQTLLDKISFQSATVTTFIQEISVLNYLTCRDELSQFEDLKVLIGFLLMRFLCKFEVLLDNEQNDKRA